MSQGTSKWFKTIKKVLCGLFFCKICCPYLDIRGFCMMIDATFLWLISIPLGWLTGVVLKLPAFVVYVCMKLDWIIKVFVCLFRFKSKKCFRIVSDSTEERNADSC